MNNERNDLLDNAEMSRWQGFIVLGLIIVTMSIGVVLMVVGGLLMACGITGGC